MPENPFPWSVLLSISASGSVGLLAFIFGVRVGKENADRKILRETYQKIYSHLGILMESTDSGFPKVYSDFQLQGDKYLPLIRSMDIDGSIHILPRPIANELLSAEQDILVTGWHYRKLIQDQLAPLAKGIFEASVSNPAKAIEKRPLRRVRIGLMMLQDQNFLHEINENIAAENHGLGLELATERGRTEQLYAYPDTMREGTIQTLLDDLARMIGEHQEATGRIAEIKRCRDRVARLKESISSRISDPHPLWETLFRGLADLFRRH